MTDITEASPRPGRKRATRKPGRKQRAPWPFELPATEVADDVDVEGPGAEPKGDQ